jgi:indolepyruvate ferredoxin oxidoreductase beta subunit
MNNGTLSKDPYNVIITGVGGQGNVTASRMLGSMLVRKGYFVTIGETFGASQRGGAVTSGMRVSSSSIWSPQIPEGHGDLVVALEPSEAIRVLSKHGNKDSKVICNTRPIYSVGVISGELKYPSVEEIEKAVGELSSLSIFVNATEEAVKLGSPILAGVILLGAIDGTGVLPVSKESFREVVSETVSGKALESNLRAYELGQNLAREHVGS